ncbi:MAG: hypothetical protein IPL26_00200 [Leptospiraceae bacterium]|nr:hypothetical protein [Leptospiraceae bacterium]
MSWDDNNDLENTSSNDAGLTLDQDGNISFDELDEEGYEIELNLDDLIDNPYRPLVAADPITKKIPVELIPSIVIGKTIFKNTLYEMLSVNYGDTPQGENENNYLNKGQVCIVREVRASFMLLGENPNLLNNWAELVAQFTSWGNIQNKPTAFPPTVHNHDDIYARLVNGKIPAKYLRTLELGERFTANSLGEMLSLPARAGDVCTRRDELKLYWLCGVNGLLPGGHSHNWVYIPSPIANVQEVNGQNGIVVLDFDDVGAAPLLHEHDQTEITDEIDEDIKYTFRQTTDGKLAVYKNGEFSFNLGEAGKVKTISGETIEFVFIDGFPYYKKDGGEPLPFA